MSCESTPTATRLYTSVTNTVSTLFSNSVSTLPSSVLTVVSPSCAATVDSTCISTTEVTALSTVDGALTTLQVPFPITVAVTVTDLKTLFAPCTDTATPSVTTQTITTILPTPSDPTTVLQTVTDTISGIQVYTTATSGQGGDTSTNNNPHNAKNVGAMVGGALGGFLGLIGIVALIIYIIQKRRKWDDTYEHDDERRGTAPARSHKSRNSRLDLDPDLGTEPKPYQYGLVGHPSTQSQLSPPSSPHQTTMGGDSITSSRHRHRSSLTPLVLPSLASTPGPSTSPPASSRPSTAGSMQPLRHSRPSTSGSVQIAPTPSLQGRPSSRRGRPTSNQGRPPSQRSRPPSHHGRPPSQHSRPPSNQGRPPSQQSRAPSRQTSGVPVDEFGVRPPSVHSPSYGSGGTNNNRLFHPITTNTTWNPYAEFMPTNDGRGSPTSLQEPRRLTLVNPNPPSSPTSSVHSEDEEEKEEPREQAGSPIVVHTDAGPVNPPATGNHEPPGYRE